MFLLNESQLLILTQRASFNNKLQLTGLEFFTNKKRRYVEQLMKDQQTVFNWKRVYIQNMYHVDSIYRDFNIGLTNS